MSNRELAETLAVDFLVSGREWNFGTHEKPEMRIPSADEILAGLEDLKRTTPVGHFQIKGWLVAVHTKDNFDIYTHIGELK